MILTKIPKPIPVGKAEDLTHRRFNKLTVLYRIQSPIPNRKEAYWLCKCDCSNYTYANKYNLTHNKIQSCGCWNKEKDRSYDRLNYNNYTGQVVNNFKIIKIDGSKPAKNGKYRHWIVICPYCNNQFSISTDNLKTQNSCGCVKSKGEYLINQILHKNNYIFQRQYSFIDLPNRYFDFAIFDTNKQLQCLIEYDGIQHFDASSRYYSVENVLRDKEKNNYCLNHNIPLYRIPYTEYDNIHDINSIFQNKFLVKG